MDLHTYLELMTAVQAGDPHAMGSLFKSFFPKLLIAVSRWSRRPPSDVEDFVMQAFVLFMDKRPQTPSPGQFYMFIFRTAANLIRRDNTKRRPQADVPIGDPADPNAPPLTVLMHSEEQGLVNDALTELNEQQREVVIHRYWGGLSYSEIADLMKLTETNARQLEFRARKALSARLGGYFV